MSYVGLGSEDSFIKAAKQKIAAADAQVSKGQVDDARNNLLLARDILINCRDDPKAINLLQSVYKKLDDLNR